MDQDSLRKLTRLIRTRSYREGQFKLASGKESTFYIDMKATTLHPEGASLVGRLVVEAILESGLPCEGVGGMTLGADPIATAVSLAAFAKGKIWPAFIVRKEAKDHGTARYLEGSENLRAGAPVVVLEDVVTTGGSSLKAIERIREAGLNPVAVVTIVDRETGGGDTFVKAGLKFLRLTTLQEVQAQPGS
jgi:orotate phosphoribosyltransferase